MVVAIYRLRVFKSPYKEDLCIKIEENDQILKSSQIFGFFFFFFLLNVRLSQN